MRNINTQIISKWMRRAWNMGRMGAMKNISNS